MFLKMSLCFVLLSEIRDMFVQKRAYNDQHQQFKRIIYFQVDLIYQLKKKKKNSRNVACENISTADVYCTPGSFKNLPRTTSLCSYILPVLIVCMLFWFETKFHP